MTSPDTTAGAVVMIAPSGRRDPATRTAIRRPQEHIRGRAAEDDTGCALMAALTESDLHRFWSLVIKGPEPDDYWLWVGAIGDDG